MYGYRAIFIAEDRTDLQRMVAGNHAQRIAVVAGDAVRQIAPVQRADAHHLTAGKVTAHFADPLGQQRAAAGDDRLQRAVVHHDFTGRRGAKDPALAVFQRRLQG